MKQLEKFRDEFNKNKKSIVEDYLTFLRFPSIATDPAFRKEVEECATWLSDYLKKSGLKVDIWRTDRAPVIFASDLQAGLKKETLLIYCHYDVQPVDPLSEWSSPPFEPRMEKGIVFARGAQDNKGQCFYTVSAIKTFLQMRKKLPINLKLVIEGEEESGSVALASLLDQKKEDLKADYLLIVDSGIEDIHQPAITLGARGIVTMEVTVEEGVIDLHSGMAGGIAYNPNRALVEMLAKLKKSDGSIAIENFYEDVKPISPEEKKELAFESDEDKFYKSFGFHPNGMEKGLSLKDASWLRPTAEINGIWGGYTGSGFKTVIPAKAHAKLSFRLVPNQDPKKIADQVQNFLKKNTPGGLKTKVTVFPGSGAGFRTNAQSKIVQTMSQSYSDVFQKPCQKILIGGSIPISVDLAKTSEAQMVLVGLGLPGDRIHAPDEHFDLDRFEKGFLTICRGIELFE